MNNENILQTKKRNSDHNSIELTGLKLGYLTVISRTNKRAGTVILWLCKCDCGKECLVRSNFLKNGTTKSCGCKRNELIKKSLTKHGKSRTKDPTYDSWRSMISRCEQPSHKSYEHYSKRGIKVCERWHKFENFLEDMGERPTNLQLDRIDNDKGYYPENCRWTTAKVNSNNRSSSVYLDFNGKRLSVSEWSQILNIPYSTLDKRLKAGWTVEKALTTKVKLKKDKL